MTYISETKIEQTPCVKCGGVRQRVLTDFQELETLTESHVFMFTALIVTCCVCGWKWAVNPLDA